MYLRRPNPVLQIVAKNEQVQHVPEQVREPQCMNMSL